MLLPIPWLLSGIYCWESSGCYEVLKLQRTGRSEAPAVEAIGHQMALGADETVGARCTFLMIFASFQHFKEETRKKGAEEEEEERCV